MIRRSVIAGTGSALPRTRVTNFDLIERGVDTNNDWVVERSGIIARYIAEEDESTVSMAVKASKAALSTADLLAQKIDLIIVATTTRDQIFPPSAVKIQEALGIGNCTAFDLQAVCAGFVYALAVADNLIKCGMATNALVIGSETMSRIVDWNDRSTCVLFGDGAGAVVLRSECDSDRGILATRLCADGRHNDLLYVDGGPSTTATVGKIRMKGREVFRHAVANLSKVFEETLSLTCYSSSDVNWIVPHQANKRILDATARKLGISIDKMIITVDEHANTSAASIPLALDQGARDGRLKRDDLIVIEGFGGGFAWGAAVVRW